MMTTPQQTIDIANLPEGTRAALAHMIREERAHVAKRARPAWVWGLVLGILGLGLLASNDYISTLAT